MAFVHLFVFIAIIWGLKTRKFCFLNKTTGLSWRSSEKLAWLFWNFSSCGRDVRYISENENGFFDFFSLIADAFFVTLIMLS